eukprot:2699912-Amphidinium_carterae.1
MNPRIHHSMTSDFDDDVVYAWEAARCIEQTFPSATALAPNHILHCIEATSCSAWQCASSSTQSLEYM